MQSPLYPSETDVTIQNQLGLQKTAPEIATGEQAVLQAVGNPRYPVTPGDTYTLRYYDGQNPVQLILQADGTSRVHIQNIGTIEAEGMTFNEFKKQVENLISTYYPYSSPQLLLTGCGMFTVKVAGEVPYTRYINAWGLTRLSDIAPCAGDYASTRRVLVTDRKGNSKYYDLYKGLRDGDEEEDPLLTPGCTVQFIPAERTVSLLGSVKRPGIYQTLEDDTLASLIESYGSGMKGNAQTASVTVANYEDGVYVTRTVDRDQFSTYRPVDGDTVYVTTAEQNLPYVTIIGAIAAPVSTKETTKANLVTTERSTLQTGNSNILSTTANRIVYNYFPGETAEHLVYSISELLLPSSDINDIYILRDGKTIEFDSAGALTCGTEGVTELKQGDMIYVPFTGQYVTVNGGVNDPGNYAYAPNKTADYYIGLAGGFSDEAKNNFAFKIKDKNGKKLKQNSLIDLGHSIQVEKKLTPASKLALVSVAVSIVYTSLQAYDLCERLW